MHVHVCKKVNIFRQRRLNQGGVGARNFLRAHMCRKDDILRQRRLGIHHYEKESNTLKKNMPMPKLPLPKHIAACRSVFFWRPWLQETALGADGLILNTNFLVLCKIWRLEIVCWLFKPCNAIVVKARITTTKDVEFWQAQHSLPIPAHPGLAKIKISRR